jgi:methyl-accepting chemotaxis protein
MNATAETLHGAISQVSETVELASRVGRSVMHSSSTVAEGAQEQSRRLEDATGSLARLAESSRNSAQNTDETQKNAQAAAESVLTAKHSMDRMLVAMGEINRSAESTATIVGEIDSIANETRGLSTGASEKAAHMRKSAGGFGAVAQDVRRLSMRCTELVTKIEALQKRMETGSDSPFLADILALSEQMREVATSSQLLGVNASIEVAHVQGAGKDFSALTGEIHGLAGRSADAARRTEVLTQTSVDQSKSGVTLSTEIDGHLKDAADGADAIRRLAGEISRATVEQAGSIEHINESVAQINRVTQKSAASAAESFGAASELNGQMERLSSMVNKFKV